MKKLLLFCLSITPLMVCAAADNNNNKSIISNPIDLKEAQMFFFHGKIALQSGDFERAKYLMKKSAELGYAPAVEALANLQEVFAEYNQQRGPGRVKVTVERFKK